MVHLHLHTHIGSILDGIGKPSEYALLAKQYGHPACGITDHGKMGGILDFQKEMKKQGIKPLIGVEMYVSDNLFVTDEKGKRERTKNSHIILYAGSEIGYKNLLKINWYSMQDDHFYYMPRVIWEEIEQYKEGLVVGTACMGSKIGRLFFDGKLVEAEEIFKKYLDTFKDNLYAEIQMNELDQQKQYNKLIIDLANKYGVPICLTGDVHYANKDDSELQTLSIMINRKQTINDIGTDHFFDIEAKSLYYTDEKDFFEFNKNWNYGYDDDFIKSCINNTHFIADKINFSIPNRSKFYIPHFDNNEQILKEKIKTGITNKFPNGFPKKYVERLQKEFEVIKNANLIDYFLIVEDYHNYAKNSLNDFCAIGRGSGVGSLILYLLDITALDPIEHELIFERFLTPERAKKDYPDIDSDFSKEIKKEIEDYLIKKYGASKVFHICTYTTFGFKSAAKDLLRIYKIDYTKSNAFTKELDDDLSWEENIQYLKDNKTELYAFYIENKKILDLTPRFSGLARNMGVHAGGLVITSDDINSIVPVDRVNGIITTAFQESGAIQELDELGVIKFDILGVKTLGAAKESIKLISKLTGRPELEIKDELYHIDLTDPAIYEEVNNKNSYNLFQMTGKAYQELAVKINPKNWEEINACNSMARPGTIEFLDDYLQGKEGIFKYPKKLQELLADTYGVCLYQEQAMKIFHEVGGFTLEEADFVRGIMKKLSKKDKNPNDIKKWEEIVGKFSKQAEQLGLTKKEVQLVTDDLVRFSSYSFNKSHCYAYSYIGVITAYLSKYYRTQFYCASLNLEEKAEDIIFGLTACKINGIKIFPPDINESESGFSTKKDNEIYFGLVGIKGVGDAALQHIIENRPYKSFKDFVTNPNLRQRSISSRIIEAIISVGCFDKTDGLENRKKLKQIAKIFWEGRKDYKVREKLEEVYNKAEIVVNSIPVLQTTNADLEAWEMEYLGYNFFTSKFSNEIFENLAKMKIKYDNDITELDKVSPVLLLVKEIFTTIDKSGKEMAFVKVADEFAHEISIPFFGSFWSYMKDLVKKDNLYLMILRKQGNSIMLGRAAYLSESEMKKSLVNLTEKFSKVK